ncbi:hypothetical protein XA68_17712 [Ophiocordyceps unilateralis]|uniref:Uncharacterized protein n=1 Tax=Ophiocordyceps unilateralis TaxID=268505 RepID=A0A2A9PIG9_OPHUN|nr:hypothetical protein XA68_17712 [Ophiocordyceps unilateralis]
MFLHAGAGLHGHEYSVKSSTPYHLPQPPTRHRHTLLRTALRPLSESGAPSRSAPYQDYRLPLAPDDGVSLSSPATHYLSPTDSLPKESAVRLTDSVLASGVSEDEDSVTATELATEAASERGSVTPASVRRPRRQRAPRKSTCYAFALPPSNKQRSLVLIRPRLLLQLQEVGDTRVTPSFNVVPSCPLTGNIFSPHLARHFPPIFRPKPQLGQDQVLVVRSDHSGPQSPPATPISGVNDRDVLAVISTLPQAGHHCADISLEDGATWAASPMANGSYEFTTVDDQDRIVTARWVRRSLKHGDGFRWTFSLMDPSSRRHPVMGSLTNEVIDVYDSYHTLSASSSLYPPSRAFADDTTGSERTTVMVTQEQKNLMLATATWISLHRQGWSTSPGSKLPIGWDPGSSGRQTFRCFGSIGGKATSPPPRQSWPRNRESRCGFRSPLSPLAKVLSTERVFRKWSAGQSKACLPHRGSQVKQQRGEKTTTRIWPWIQRLMDRGRSRECKMDESFGQKPEKGAPGE